MPNMRIKRISRSGQQKTPRFGGLFLMELGGLEPPTSWVRSRRSLASNNLYLQEFLS